MCFLRPNIKETNFTTGIFNHNIIGDLNKSSKKYFFKHMGGFMGYEFYKNKTINTNNTQNKLPETHYTYIPPRGPPRGMPPRAPMFKQENTGMYTSYHTEDVFSNDNKSKDNIN